MPVCRRFVDLAATSPNSTTHLAAVSQLGRCLLLVEEGEEALSVLAEARSMLLQRTKGHPHRWITEIDEQIEEARALVARSRPAPR